MLFKCLDKIVEYTNKITGKYLEKSEKYRHIVTLDKHKIRHVFGHIDKIKNGKQVYDENSYINGNIFIKGKTNPIYINYSKKLKLEKSDRYKDVLKASIIKDIFNPKDKLETIVFIILLTSIGTLAISVINMLGLI